MASYKDLNREIKGYVEVLYGVKKTSTTIPISLGISRNTLYSNNYYLSAFTHSQSLQDTLDTNRLVNNYAVLCDEMTSLDGSFFLFNKAENKSGFYSTNTIDYYVDYIEGQGYEARDFVLKIGDKSNLIDIDTTSLTLYTQNNNFSTSPHGNRIFAELYDEEDNIIETTTELFFYDNSYGANGNQLIILFENSLKDHYVLIKGLDFEYYDRPAIITHIDLGMSHIYKDNELIEFTVTEEVDKLVQKTPANELSVTIGDYEMIYDPLNPNGITKYLTEDSLFIPYIGINNDDNEVEYTKMGTFYYDSIDYQEGQVTITAYNLINKLNKVMIKDDNYLLDYPILILKGNLNEKIIAYLNTCYDYDYNIDIENSGIMTTGSLKYICLNELLQMFAMIDGVYYIDRNKKITIKKIDNTVKNTLSKYELKENIKYTNINNIKGIVLKKQLPYRVGLSSAATIEQTHTMINTEDEVVIFSENALLYGANISITGATSYEIISGYFLSMIFLKISGEIGSNVTITVNYYYENRRTQGEISYGETNANIEIENPLYFLENISSDFSNFIEKIPTYEVSLNYNGDPTIEAGQYIEVETDYGYIPVFVQKHSLTFDGGLSGTIEGVE